MEKLYDLHDTGAYDCIVIDTPPTRNALDFLDAPQAPDRLPRGALPADVPGARDGGRQDRHARGGVRDGAVHEARRRALTGARRSCSDLAEFFQSFEGMYDGFKHRAQAVYKLLQSPTAAAFVVVASAEPPALREARFFLQRLAQDGMPMAGLVVNRVTPPAPKELTALKASDVNAAIQQLTTGPEERAAAALLGLHADRVAVHGRERGPSPRPWRGSTPGSWSRSR